jgi:thiol-disulfide isomerase/thioredoxin
MPAESGPRPSRRYPTFVGIAFLVLIAVATVNTIRTNGGATLERGTPLPEFAVPDARTGPLDKDANIAQDDCSTSENPCPSDASRPSACQIPRAGAIRVCDLFDRPLVISFWFTKGASCLPTQDLADQAARRYRGRVNFLSINIRDDPSTVRQIASEHRWTMPVGYDRDGAVSDLYRVGVCPTLIFAYPGGILDFEKIGTGELSAPMLNADVQRLLRQSRQRAREER